MFKLEFDLTPENKINTENQLINKISALNEQLILAKKQIRKTIT
jgi:hypothetical protein